ncbi:MAG: hypothetical protein WCD76_19810 [Pyrinomonadaceae bacterium]
MSQLWTVIFVTLLAIAFCVAGWHDRDKSRRRERRNGAHRMGDGKGD